MSQQLLGVQEVFKMGDVGKLEEISTTLTQVYTFYSYNILENPPAKLNSL